jgi:hypothetical protein
MDSTNGLVCSGARWFTRAVNLHNHLHCKVLASECNRRNGEE